MNDRGSVLQFEIDRKRAARYPKCGSYTVADKYEDIFYQSMIDTLRNGGTFVLVVTEDKITAVQRPDAEDFANEDTTHDQG